MLFNTKTVLIAIMAVAGANAAAAPQQRPGRPEPARPVRPSNPTFNMQSISCGGGASPFCCSPNNVNEQAGSGGFLNDQGNQNGGTTCRGGQTQCNAVVVCCNNNGRNAQQDCGANISILNGPIRFE